MNNLLKHQNHPVNEQVRNGKGIVNPVMKLDSNHDQNQSLLVKAIRDEAGEEVLSFIQEHFSFQNQQTILYTSKNVELYDNVDFNNIRAIINLQEVNRHRKVNSLLRSINTLLPDAGLYVGCAETYDIRKSKLIRQFGKTFTSIIWVADFLINRVAPRLTLTKNLYYFLTQNKYRVISLAETLGRLKYCGFDIIEYREINDKKYFVVMKTSEPNLVKASFGPIFKMNRIGQNGKMIKVFKLRTMHPYSEFLQDYIVKMHGYNEVGKVKSDFRLTGWGKVFRKLWLDELPQIINVFRGELGIVGVRPLSLGRFNQFPEDVRQERILHKPGCIPPYVALCMPDADGNIEAERIYMNDLKKSPLTTNFRYFWKAVFNILTNKIHSA